MIMMKWIVVMKTNEVVVCVFAMSKCWQIIELTGVWPISGRCSDGQWPTNAMWSPLFRALQLQFDRISGRYRLNKQWAIASVISTGKRDRTRSTDERRSMIQVGWRSCCWQAVGQMHCVVSVNRWLTEVDPHWKKQSDVIIDESNENYNSVSVCVCVLIHDEDNKNKDLTTAAKFSQAELWSNGSTGMKSNSTKDEEEREQEAADRQVTAGHTHTAEGRKRKKEFHKQELGW